MSDLGRTKTVSVEGYSPILLACDIRTRLADFRKLAVPCDLRIERALVSAAIELGLEQGATDSLLSRIREFIAHDPGDGIANGQHMPGFGSVLMRYTVKGQLRKFGMQLGIFSGVPQAERILGSIFVENVLSVVAKHPAWVERAADFVRAEVTEAYRHNAANVVV